MGPERGAADREYLVTGGNGFLGSHCVKQLLADGRTVRATVRDPDGPKAAFLRKLPGAERLVLRKADLMDSVEHWRSVVRGCTVVLHTASPFQVEGVPSQQEEFFLKPAVTGTENVIKACIEEGVKRVVLTSSVAAIEYGHGEDPRLKAPGPDESFWTDVNALKLPVQMYMKSKTVAEQAAWKLVEQVRLELVTICPSLMVGPLLSSTGGEGSGVVVRALLNGEYPAIPDIPLNLVDVRDVAKMHVRAADVPAAAGKRYLATSRPVSVSLLEIAQHLKDLFPAYPVPPKRMPIWLLRLVSRVDLKLAMVLPTVGTKLHLNAKNGNELIGGAWIDWRNSLKEMAETMIWRGLVRKPKPTTACLVLGQVCGRLCD